MTATLKDPGLTRADLHTIVQEKITAKVEDERLKRGLSIRAMATLMGMNHTPLHHRMAGRTDWTLVDVVQLKRLWNVDVLED